ncbi:MAG: thiamine-phosphate kinase [Pseudomonadota bacterium]
MPAGEFDVIDRYFRPLGLPGGRARRDVLRGVGDDAAVLRVPAGQELVAAIDTLVAGRHFLVDSDPAAIGHRALAVNLSDLAAMGATPAWALLALTLPTADETFLHGFARGFGMLAASHDLALVGGDTTSGPLTISVQVLGFVPAGSGLTRDGAAAGDLVFVSGNVGDAAAGLQLEQGRTAPRPGQPEDETALRRRLLYPTPRVALGQQLRGLASACIDVSDGLAADAGKLAVASGCGLRLEAEQLPLSGPLVALQGADAALQLALTGGDDYELCFTLAPGDLAQLPERLAGADCTVQCIGVLEATPGIRVWRQGRLLSLPTAGFDHFVSVDT